MEFFVHSQGKYIELSRATLPVGKRAMKDIPCDAEYTHCKECGGYISLDASSDTLYCKSLCRSRAWNRMKYSAQYNKWTTADLQAKLAKAKPDAENAVLQVIREILVGRLPK